MKALFDLLCVIAALTLVLALIGLVVVIRQIDLALLEDSAGWLAAHR